MRIENNYNFKSLWFCYKIIGKHKFYVSFFIYRKRCDFVIFKIDYIEKRFFAIMFMNLTFYMSYDGSVKRFFFYKEKQFKVLIKKLKEDEYK